VVCPGIVSPPSLIRAVSPRDALGPVGFESVLPIGTKDGTKGEVEYRELTDEERAQLEKEIREDGSPEEKEFLRLKEKIESAKLSLKDMMEP